MILEYLYQLQAPFFLLFRPYPTELDCNDASMRARSLARGRLGQRSLVLQHRVLACSESISLNILAKPIYQILVQDVWLGRDTKLQGLADISRARSFGYFKTAT